MLLPYPAVPLAPTADARKADALLSDDGGDAGGVDSECEDEDGEERG